MSENSVVQQILSNDRDGIRSFDENLIKGLAGLAEYDPIEYARRKPVQSDGSRTYMAREKQIFNSCLLICNQRFLISRD